MNGKNARTLRHLGELFGLDKRQQRRLKREWARGRKRRTGRGQGKAER